LKDKMTKRYLFAALGAVLATAGLTATAAPASAGCVNPGPTPMAQMCDSPADSDGMWERCLTSYPGGPLNPAKVDCETMSAGDPPKEADPIFSTIPTHIDP
jgi:lipoprotein-anchoring transpeptidase ErfK/SrfK